MSLLKFRLFLVIDFLSLMRNEPNPKFAAIHKNVKTHCTIRSKKGSLRSLFASLQTRLMRVQSLFTTYFALLCAAYSLFENSPVHYFFLITIKSRCLHHPTKLPLHPPITSCPSSPTPMNRETETEIKVSIKAPYITQCIETILLSTYQFVLP